jgi:hypothetical protein
VPDTWRCVCGYTNMNAKACLVCRRPRQAVAPGPPPASISDPVPEREPAAEPEAERPLKRPLRAAKATKKKTTPRRTDKRG